jgi:hypothetical protein
MPECTKPLALSVLQIGFARVNIPTDGLLNICWAAVSHLSFMNVTGFTPEQEQALLDLLVIGMYADHNLASAEDERVKRLLATFQFSSDYVRDNFSDAAFTRASRQSGSPDAIRAYVGQIASHFPTREIRKKAYDLLDDMLTSDGSVTSEESKLLSATREIFQL